MFCLRNTSTGTLVVSDARDYQNQPLQWDAAGARLAHRFVGGDAIEGSKQIANLLQVGLLAPDLTLHAKVRRVPAETLRKAYETLFGGLSQAIVADSTLRQPAAPSGAEAEAAAKAEAEAAAKAEAAEESKSKKKR